MYTAMCKQIANGKPLHSAENSAQGSVTTWRGGGLGRRLKREGVGVHIELIHFLVQQQLTQHWKAIKFWFKFF